jgi:hypothetical protein
LWRIVRAKHGRRSGHLGGRRFDVLHEFSAAASQKKENRQKYNDGALAKHRYKDRGFSIVRNFHGACVHYFGNSTFESDGRYESEAHFQSLPVK